MIIKIYWVLLFCALVASMLRLNRKGYFSYYFRFSHFTRACSSHRQYLLFLFLRLSQKGCLKPTALFIVILNCRIQYVKELICVILFCNINYIANIQTKFIYTNIVCISTLI